MTNRLSRGTAVDVLKKDFQKKLVKFCIKGINVNSTLEQATKAQRGSRGIVLLFL